MTPAEWMAQEGRSLSSVAAEVGAHKSTVHRMIAGERFPSFPVILLFHRLSAGAVGLDDWAALFRRRKDALPASRLAEAPVRRLLKRRKGG